MGGQTIATSETKIEALKLQSSAFGVTIPLVFGVTRISGNLIWYGGFKATPHTEETSSGKGGVRTVNTTYTYSASVMMGLCHGPIQDVPRVWRGKDLFTTSGAQGHAATALSEMGLSMAPGTVGQAVWSGLSAYAGSSTGQSYRREWKELDTDPVEAVRRVQPASELIGYSGLAYVAGQDYDLGQGAQVENHNFEVVAAYAYHLGPDQPDVDPALALREVLTSPRAGAGLPAGIIGDWNRWSDYCVSGGMLVSPALTEQQRAADVLKDAARLTNTGIVWSGGRLKMVPYGDAAQAGNGRTFTPDVTPVYDLDDECWIISGNAPLRVDRKTPSDRYNQVRLEFLNRANQYNPEPVVAEDLADITTFGLRPMPSALKAHWICQADVARMVAQLVMQRSLYVQAEYSLQLPWHFALLEPMDLVTLTDPTLALAKRPVRIIEIEESDAGDLAVKCEDYPAGVASATRYAVQESSGFALDYNARPGSALAPVIFEAPGGTDESFALCVAVGGSGALWGGCHVWVSLDGLGYRRMGTLQGSSRYGTLTKAIAAAGDELSVQVSGTLTSATQADAKALQTLAWIGGAKQEWIAYRDVVLIGAGAYKLSGLVRGAYESGAQDHEAGAPFVRVDESVVRSEAMDRTLLRGTLVRIKIQAFNAFGASAESLDQLQPYTYRVAEAPVRPKPPDVVTGGTLSVKVTLVRNAAEAALVN